MLLATTFAVGAMQSGSSIAFAKGKRTPEGGATLLVNLQIDGTYYDDAGAKKRLCSEGFTFFAATSPPSFELPNDPGTYKRTIDGVEQTLFWTMCFRTPPPPADDPNRVMSPEVRDQRTAWVGRPNPGAVIDTISAQLPLIIDPPIVSWPTIDPEFGWLYINSNMEFRVAALTPKTLTGTLANILGTATATLTATPTSVTFYSGEPSGGTAICSVADATADYHNEIIGACTYRYRAASSVAANARTFDTRMVVTWNVTGDLGPNTPTTLETYTEAPVAVAEVQALVCATIGC